MLTSKVSLCRSWLRQTRGAVGLVVLLLPGCGVVNNTAQVRQDETAQIPFVEVEMTQATVAQANLSQYVPKQLPDIFYYGSAGSATLTSPLPPQTEQQPYRLGPGDVIAVNGKSLQSTTLEPDFRPSETQYQLRDDGTLEIPGIGKLRLGGLTLPEADDELASLLVRERIDPNYRIEVSVYNARAVTIDGAVGAPGVVPITQTPLTIDRALAVRGGLRVEDRSAATVILYRTGQRYSLRGSDVATMAKVVLRDGDSLVVDPGRSLSIERDLYAARSQENVEPRDLVFIAGEVGAPRASELPVGRQAYLSEVLLDAGGVPLISGDLSEVYVIRTYGHDYRATVYHLDASNVVNLALATRFELRPFDIVFVSEQPVTRWARVLSQLNPSEIFRVINAVR